MIYEIRDIIEDDSHQYIKLNKQINSENPYMIRPADIYEILPEQIMNEVREHKTEDYKYWKVIIWGDTLIGHAKIGRSKKERLRHKAEFTIGIVKEHTGKGIGSLLINDCIKWCSKNGVERLDLKVVEENRGACKLYERSGFERTGYLKNDIRIAKDKYYDSIHMSRFIEESK